MTKKLRVYWGKIQAGILAQDEHGEITFQYSESWLANSNALPLSQSLPLRQAQFSNRECRAFFSGLLPEEENRRIVARNLGLSAENYFSLLSRIGGECAGAIHFSSDENHQISQIHDYKFIDESSLAQILRELPHKPLCAGEEGVRLSLAGAQDKIALHEVNGKYAVPLDGAASSIILKPAHQRFANMVYNEAFCMKLAQAIGLNVANVSIEQAEEIEYLKIQRYDRLKDKSACIERIHQEDFCQALGIVSERKYEIEGGPSLKNCFELLRKVSSTPIIDILALLEAVLFNVIIGNNDAHAKNFSLLYYNAHVSLSPLYDLVCTSYYEVLDHKMAMRIATEYDSLKLYGEHFKKMAKEIQVNQILCLERMNDLLTITIEKSNEIADEDQRFLPFQKFIVQRAELYKQRLSS
jgi:serine/threonine-protein kinase HipA